ncbi:hypothetical protein BGX31_006787 [Mortierella sp. GBA43]|nr:hypothetical protein BGX31_006787 [Mortierella sp. GBA43]
MGFPEGHCNLPVQEKVPSQPEPETSKFYFKPKTPDSTDKMDKADRSPVFICTSKVEASKRFTHFSLGNISSKGLHNVCIAVSLEHLNMGAIESISFLQGKYFRLEALEVYTRCELRKLRDASESKTLVLGLHHQHNDGDQAFGMEIRTLVHASPQEDPGYIELHYIELRPFQLSEEEDGECYRPHQPCLFSIDVTHSGKAADRDIPQLPAKVIFYTVSGDNNYVVTLSTRGTSLQLKIWDLRARKVSTKGDRWSSCAPQLCAEYHTVLPKPIDFGPNGTDDIPPLGVAISYDGTMVILMDSTRHYLEKPFQAFALQEPQDPLTRQEHPRRRFLTPITEVVNDSTINEQLSELQGFGKFHCISMQDHHPKERFFITCSKAHVDIYSVHNTLTHIRRIHLSRTCSMKDAWRLVEGIGGRFFSWSDKNDNLLVGDLITGKLVHLIASFRGSAHFSSDGSLMVCYQASGALTVRLTESGTILAATNVLGVDYHHAFPAFIENDSRVIVTSAQSDDSFGRGLSGMTLDTDTLSIIDRVSIPIHLSMQQPQSIGSHGQYIFSPHGSKLDLVHLQDHVVQPYPLPRYQCKRECLRNLEPLSNSEPQSVQYSDHFINIEFQEASNLHRDLVVSISNGQGKPRVILKIPPLLTRIRTGEVAEFKFYINREQMQLVTYCNRCIMLWKLPTTMEGGMMLESTWETEPRYWTDLATCTHGQLYARIWDGEEYYSFVLRRDEAFVAEPARFFRCLLLLISMFDTGDNQFQQSILQYVGCHINKSMKMTNSGTKISNCRTETVLAMICREVTQENREVYGKFLKALLESPHGRWIPRPAQSPAMDPISILLKTAQASPRTVGVVEIVIDYCVRMARTEKDPRFVSPIVALLPDIVKQKESHPDLVYRTLRGLSFIPVKEKSIAIDRGIIAHPHELRFQFWKPLSRPIYKCVNPVMKLDRTLNFKKHDTANDNFVRDVFVASFDMLWRVRERKAPGRSGKNGRTPWFRVFPSLIMLKHKFKPKVRVECHDFSLEMLHNPALEALIEYKWNTIGHAYWFSRFICQLIFYALIMTAVVVQVYYSELRDSLTGVFIAIIAIALGFLSLELNQMVNNTRRYFASPYNFMDFAVFSIPLGGSIRQIINISNNDETGGIAALSFGVLIVFIHLLLELRINQSVCHFVTIIFRILNNIKTFFVVFAGGIFAFTIAILHLLHGCSVSSCSDKGSKFPSNLYRAVSSTYFFMGGVWDPIDDNFDSDDWAFHIMMILYFFFTTILLLNVLIAPINVAFNNADEVWMMAWTKNRLRCIQEAETLSYNIPGFRKIHDWFPDEIYYTATLQQQKDYYAQYPQEDNDEFRAGYNTTLSKQLDQSSSRLEPTLDSVPVPLNAASAGLEVVRQGCDDLNRQQTQLRQEMSTKFSDIQQQLERQEGFLETRVQDKIGEIQEQLREQQRVFQEQLQEQQRGFERQLDDIKEILAAALATKP